MTILARPSEWTRTAREATRPPAGARTQHYFAFLSYSHRDEATAKWLHDSLEKFRVPASLVGRLTEHGPVPRRLTPIFRDLGELPASDDLGTEIRDALAGSRFLIVLCSPAAAASRWTNAEIEAFKRLRPEGCVLAAVLDGEPFASDIAGREAEECLPLALRFHYDRRGRRTNKRAEPLAADFRGGPDARRLGLLKLVAGMLGVGLDDLVQRESMRRQRRLGLLAAASIAGMVLTSALAVTAIQARDSARDQRREAEGLVAFMLGDLKDKLEPIGRLDALDGVGARVLDYYSKQDTADLSDAALLQRARALSLTAQVAYLRGDLDGASRLYREAMAGTREAVSRAPDEPQRLFDHAQNVFWTGELARYRGRLEEAEAAYREYKRLADRMVALEPDNLKWRMEYQYAATNLGIALYNRRRFADAERQFAGALGPMESLASIDADNAEYQKELSAVIAWLADAQRAQGRLDSAIALRQRQVAFLRGPRAQGGANVSFRQHLVPAQQALGMLLVSRGQTDAGIEQLRGAVAEADRLVPIEPDNTYWGGLAAQAHLELAKTLLLAGNSAEAAGEARAGCALAEQVRMRDPAAAWRPLQTACLEMRARLALQSGAAANALAFAERAIASASEAQSADRIRDLYRVADAYRLLGDVHRQTGNRDRAVQAWTAGLKRLPTGIPELPAETAVRAALLERLGMTEELKLATDRLRSIGYRRVA